MATMSGPPPPAMRPDPFAPRWAEYRKLRRTWLFAMLGIVALAGSAFVAFRLLALEREPARSILGLFVALCFFVCWALGLAAWLTLMTWRCPRCGKRFVGSSGPLNRCKHCGVLVGTRSDTPPPWTHFRIG